jgi:hypothetical protein
MGQQMKLGISDFQLGRISSKGTKFVVAAALFGLATYANAAVCGATDVNECEISFASSGSVTLTLLADHGSLDHGFFLIDVVGGNNTLVFASSNGTDAALAGTDSGTTSVGATITPIGATFTINNYVAGSELVFGLFGYESVRWGGTNNLVTKFYTGSMTANSDTPIPTSDGNYISFVEGGGTNNLTVHMTDLFGQASNFNGSEGNIMFSAQLAPVPEPESYAMLLAGLGLMAVVARRRSK